jgi:hypothetical protein
MQRTEYTCDWCKAVTEAEHMNRLDVVPVSYLGLRRSAKDNQRHR